LTRSRHHLYSNSLREKRISVEPTVRAYSAGKTTIEEKAAEHPRSPTWKPPVNGQNCHHETKHWEETMKTLRVKQNRVQTTVRRRQYDDRRENCTACIHHRFSVTCTTAILILRFVSNYATGNFSLWFGWKQQNIFTRLFKPTVNRQKNFWVGVFVRRYFSPATSAEKRNMLRARASKQTKNEVWRVTIFPLKRRLFISDLLFTVTFSLRFLFRA